MPRITQIQVYRGAFVNLPLLAIGEFGWCTDTKQLWIGDGVTNRLIPAGGFDPAISPSWTGAHTFNPSTDATTSITINPHGYNGTSWTQTAPLIVAGIAGRNRTEVTKNGGLEMYDYNNTLVWYVRPDPSNLTITPLMNAPNGYAGFGVGAKWSVTSTNSGIALGAVGGFDGFSVSAKSNNPGSTSDFYINRATGFACFGDNVPYWYSSAQAQLHVGAAARNSTALLTALILDRLTTFNDPGIAGMGATLDFKNISSTTVGRFNAHFQWEWVIATDASRTSRMRFYVYDTAAREAVRIEASGSAPMIGFLGAGAIARPAAYTQTYAAATRTHANLTSSTLTDNSGGTPSTTVQALTDPANAPVDADALRDDLVANLIPELRNNIADLVAQVNALRVDLENTKQVLNQVVDDHQSFGLLQ